MKKQRYCHICGKPINSSRSHWMLHPQCLDKPGKHGHVLAKTRYDFLCFNFPKLKNKNDIQTKYLKEEWSLPMLCKYIDNIDLKAMQFILNYYSIPIRSVKEARKSGSRSQIAIEKTNIKRYGKTNVLAKGTEPWKKKNKTVYDKYGVDNVWQCLSQFVNIHVLGQKISTLNKFIENILIQNNIKYESEFIIHYINEVDQKKHCKFYDFLIPNIKLIIEANGDYWHANPKIYKKNDVLHMRNTIISAKFIWETDKFKKELAEKNGYSVIYIWESDIKNKPKDIEKYILKIIKEKEN